jgi:hypothetical protein
MLDVFFDKWWRLGGVAGILFLIMFIAGGVLMGDSPSLDKSTDEIRDWYADNGDQFLVGNYIIGLAFAFFFFPFLAGLQSLLASAERGPQMWSKVAFAGGLTFLIFGAVSSFFWATLAYSFGVVEQGEDVPIKTIMYLDQVGTSTFPLPLIALVLGTSLICLRTGVLWRWLSILALVVAVFVVINGASLLTSDADGALGGIGFISFPAFALWLLLVSINMILKKEAPAAA